MIALLCALVSGGMFYLAEGVDDVWALGWIAPVPLLWLAYRNCSRWQLYLASVAAFASGQIYLFQCYGGLSMPLVLRVAVAPCILFGAAIVFAREAKNRLPAAVALFAFPASWAATDYGVGAIAPDGPFTSLANAQVAFPAALQVASLFGFAAITFLLCLFANGVATLLGGARRAGALGLAICALALIFGFVRLGQPQKSTVHVVALADTGLRIRAWKAEAIEDSLAASAAYADRIRELAAQETRVDIVAIPEGAIAMRHEWGERALAPLADAAKDTGTMIVVGVAMPDPVMNRAITFTGDGTAISYDKRHPLQPMETELPGTAPGLLGDGRAVAICKDMDFPASIRADIQSGIRIMVVPASDFGRDDWIHARMAILRGVENGFAVLRSAFNGLETVSDAYGRVLATTNTSRMGMITLIADLPLGPGSTLYSRIGDLFAGCCVMASMLMAAVMFGRSFPWSARSS